MNYKQRGDSATFPRWGVIAKWLLVLTIVGLGADTGFRLWSLGKEPAPDIALNGTTSATPWQFVDKFPTEITDELHFILIDSETPIPASTTRDDDLPPTLLALDRILDPGGLSTESLMAVGATSPVGRLARYSSAGKITAFGINSHMTFFDMTVRVISHCGVAISDEFERSVSFTSKNGTHWKCLLIDGDSEDRFLLCETIDNEVAPQKIE